MRHHLAAALVLALAGLGAVSARAQNPTGQGEPLVTPEQHGESNIGNAASGPMHDMNIFRQKIPPVLLAAVADPYARPPSRCSALVALVTELNEALGPDLDLPESLNGKADMKLSLVHVGSEMLLPFNGAVRALSGAEKHDHQVLAAIIAGGVRRGYLKGLGEAHGCYPPAIPRHLLVPASPVVEEGHTKPLYPTR